jgi:hypothetical protein
LYRSTTASPSRSSLTASGSISPSRARPADYKAIQHDRHAQIGGPHIPVALVLTRGRHYTLPLLKLGGRTIGDSTAIIAALEQAYPEPTLYPADPDERRRALELEDWFDEHLGPSIRRYVFHELRAAPELFDELASRWSRRRPWPTSGARSRTVAATSGSTRPSPATAVPVPRARPRARARATARTRPQTRLSPR